MKIPSYFFYKIDRESSSERRGTAMSFPLWSRWGKPALSHCWL